MNRAVQHVKDGAEAIAYLSGEAPYNDRTSYPMPKALFVDLKMPKVDGLDLLTWVRRESSIPHLPVVIMTGSNEINDVKQAFALGANSFLVKPVQLENLKEVLKLIDSFWDLLRTQPKAPGSVTR